MARCTGTLTTTEKIEAIETSSLQIAFDSCHKNYLLDGAEEVAEALANGYDIYSASLIRETIGRSCGLVFVSRWDLGESPSHGDWQIEQCTEDIFDAAEHTAHTDPKDI